MGKMKWDSVADQILFTKLLETHDIAIDCGRVAEAWPAQDEEAKPTPRAIRERIFKIKELSRANAAATGGSSPVTPKKRTPRKKNNDTATPGSPPRKRKRVTKTTVNPKEGANSDDESGGTVDKFKSSTNLESLDPSLHAHSQAVPTNEDGNENNHDSDNHHANDDNWTLEQDEDANVNSASEHLNDWSQ